jgi:predicted transcriptional regulator
MRQPKDLSRRERQILDVIYEMESASVKDVQNALADGSSESTIRTLLGILVAKGVLKKQASGLKFMYFPVVEKEKASLQALENVVATFFDKKPSLAVRSLLEMKKGKISAEEIAEIEALLESKKGSK